MADVCLLVLFLSSSSPDTLVDLYYNVNANNGLLQNAIVGVQLGEKKRDLVPFFLTLIYMLLNNLSGFRTPYGYSSADMSRECTGYLSNW